jgi:hypothetical protein
MPTTPSAASPTGSSETAMKSSPVKTTEPATRGGLTGYERNANNCGGQGNQRFSEHLKLPY